MNEVSVTKDVVYGSGGGRELKCDVYTPVGLAAPAPGVLLIHGGGWRQGERGMMEGYGRRLAAAGFVGVAPEYRLTGESAWPAQIEDIKAAIRWVRARSVELAIDEGRIALLGRSAGAHLALLAGGTPGMAEFEGSVGNEGVGHAAAAVIAIFPPTLFYGGDERVHGGTPARALMGDAAADDAARAVALRAASPVAHVSTAFPPTFLLHGTADKVVPPSASMVMYEALVRAGVPVEMHLYAEQPHGFAGQAEFIDLCCAEITHFLGRYLVAPGLAPEAEAAPVASPAS